MLIKSALVTQISGSIGGMTGSHNRGGQYLRARTIPTNPGTPQQNSIRQFVADLVNLWNSTVTALQRDAWDTYAVNVAFVNRLGDQTFLSGLNQYVRSNVPRLQAGLPRVDDAPVIFNTGEFTQTAIGFSAAANDILLNFTAADAWANEDDAGMLVYGSRPKNATVNYFKGPYRFATAVLGDAITPPTSPDTSTNPFPFILGQKLFAYVRVSRADGRLSTLFRMSAIAIA